MKITDTSDQGPGFMSCTVLCIAVDDTHGVDDVHDMTDPVDRFWWHPVLGPTSSFILGRLFDNDGCELEVSALAWECGALSDVMTRRSLTRLLQFSMLSVAPIDHECVLVRPFHWMRAVSRTNLNRAPAWWSEAYVTEVRRRGHDLTLST